MKTIPYGHQCIDNNDIKEVIKVFTSDWLTQGPKVKEFEARLCDYTRAKYTVAVSSGTAALHLASLAAGIGKGDEVITSPVTFIATANSILYCGGRPVFADIQEDTANIDPEEINKKINRKTKGIIPVHFAGHPCDLKEIRALASRHHLTVIEDAAHALGAQYMGTKIGSCAYSDMTIFSFHPLKTITTGEGGAITTNNKRLYKKLLALRTHGTYRDKALTRKYGPWYYEMRELGFNYRLTDIQSALGLSQLKKTDRFVKIRNEIADIYNKNLSGVEEIILPVSRPFIKSSWHLYCLRLKNPALKKKAFEKLLALGINCQVHYIPVYLHPYYKKLGYRQGICKVAEDLYKRALSIPLYPSLKSSQVDKIIRSIQDVFTRR